MVRLCNLSHAIEEKGIEIGIEQKSMSVAEAMIQDNESASKIIKYTRLPIETLQKIADRLGKTLVLN